MPVPPRPDDDPLLAGLFAAAADGPLGQLPPAAGRQRERRWWQRYGPARAMLLVVLLVAPGFLEPYAQEAAHQGLSRLVRPAAAAPGYPRAEPADTGHQAAEPTPSGAYPPYPLNHTFDAYPRLVGTPPANFALDAAGTATGSPPPNADVEAAPVDAGVPTNNGFATGDFTGWNQAGTPSIGTDPTRGYVAQITNSTSTLTTAAFAVSATAQAFAFDLVRLASGGSFRVSALTGPTYATVTQIGTLCVTGCDIGTWTSASISAVPYQGQTIRLRFQRNTSGSWGFDDVRARELVPGFNPTGLLRRETANGSTVLLAADDFTTGPMTVAVDAQHGRFAAQGLVANTQWEVFVLSGANFGTPTKVLTVYFPTAGFDTFQFPLYPWAGQSIRLRFKNIWGGARFDDIGVQRIDVPGWMLSDASITWGTTATVGALVVPGVDVEGNAGGTAVSLRDERMTSAAFTVDAAAQQLSLRHKGTASGSAFSVTVLYGANFAQSASLTGASNVPSAQGDWQTYWVPIGPYAGQTIKLRIAVAGRTLFDDVGFTGSAVPGWTPQAQGTNGAVAVGEDANGTYVTAFTAGGTFELESAPVSAGVVDDPARLDDGRSIALGYAFGGGGSSTGVTVWWVPLVQGSPGVAQLVYNVTTDGTQAYKDARFVLRESFLGTLNGTRVQTGFWRVKGTGGARIYSIADNVARQQLSEPFSQQVGGIDTSTGSFGWAQEDLVVAGGPLPLVLTRYYAGHSDRLGAMGYRWRHSFDTQLYIGAGLATVAVLFAAGGEEAFELAGGAYRAVDPRVRSTLARLPDPANPGQFQYVYTAKGGTVWTFDDTGRLVTVTDPNGNAIGLVYDGSTGRLATVSTLGGRSLTFAYDGNGSLTSVTGPDNVAVTYTYLAQSANSTIPNLVQVELPDGGRQQYEYSRRRLKRVWERQGRDLPNAAMVATVVNTLDAFNRVTQQQDGEGHLFRIDYQTLGSAPTPGVNQVRDKTNGGTTAFYYDHFGRTQAVTTTAGGLTTFAYDAAGNLTTWVDGAAGAYQFGYNESGDVTQVTDPLGQPTNVEVNPAHLPVEVRDANGVLTLNTYDGAGNKVQERIDSPVNRLGQPSGPTPPGGFLDLMTVWTYDQATGLPTSETVDPAKDWQGNERGGDRVDLMRRFGYDPSGRLTSVTVDPRYDPAGNDRGATRRNLTTSYTYDAYGRLTAETDPDGVMTRYVYSGAGRLVRVILDPSTDAAGQTRTGTHLDLTSQYVYDVPGNLIIAADPVCYRPTTNVCQTEWFYDKRNLVTDKYDDLGARTTYAYDPNGRMTTVTVDADKPGYTGQKLVTQYVYDEDGRLKETVTDPGGLNLTTAYAYDSAGRLTAETVDPDRTGYVGLALATTYTYSGDRLVGKTQPDGGEWSYAYDAVGRPTRTVDPMGHAVDTAYDRAGRVKATIVDPDEPSTGHVGMKLTTSYAYDRASRLRATTDRAGTTTTYAYDGAGRLWTTTVDPDDGAYDGLNLVTATTYTAAGRVDTTTDPDGFATDYDYDTAGRLWRVTAPGNRVTEYAYDANGQPTLVARLDPVTGARLTATATTYDRLGRIAQSVVDPDDPATAYVGDKLTTGYGYDKAGRRTTMTDPKGRTTEFRYDRASRLWKIVDAAVPTAGVVQFGYDAAGRTTSVANARGYATGYGYALSATAGAGWVTTVTDPLSRERTTTANLLGQPLTIEDANGNVLTHAYDAANRLVRIYDPAFFPTVGNYVAYVYDALGQPTSIANPNGTVGYAYDEAGRVEQVTSPQGTVAYTSTGNGRRATMTLPSAGSGPRVVTYGYDPGSGDLATLADWTGGAPTEFDFDGLGLPAETRRPNGVATRYAFDRALRLTGISHVDAQDVALAEYGYDYDANGNRTRLDVTGTAVANGSEAYGYDELNRLEYARALDGSEVGFAYDANGNLTGVSPAGGTAIAYGYDAADQLQEVDGVDLFDYDANGNRIAHGADTYTWDWANRLTGADVQGAASAFAYLGDGSRASVARDGTTTTGYLWDRAGGLPRLLDDGATSAVHAGGGVLAEVDDATGARRWALADGLGSVRARTDGSGAVTDTGSWDAWGQATDAPEGLFGWAGEQTDPSTGLVYLRARSYSPLYGRFLSQDPVSPNGPGTQGYNPYAYATNNPTTLTDPSGLLPGLGGLGQAVGNVFAYLSNLLECYLFGECRYQRRFAPGGGGERPESGGGAGAGTGGGLVGANFAPQPPTQGDDGLPAATFDPDAFPFVPGGTPANAQTNMLDRSLGGGGGGVALPGSGGMIGQVAKLITAGAIAFIGALAGAGFGNPDPNSLKDPDECGWSEPPFPDGSAPRTAAQWQTRYSASMAGKGMSIEFENQVINVMYRGSYAADGGLPWAIRFERMNPGWRFVNRKGEVFGHVKKGVDVRRMLKSYERKNPSTITSTDMMIRDWLIDNLSDALDSSVPVGCRNW